MPFEYQTIYLPNSFEPLKYKFGIQITTTLFTFGCICNFSCSLRFKERTYFVSVQPVSFTVSLATITLYYFETLPFPEISRTKKFTNLIFVEFDDSGDSKDFVVGFVLIIITVFVVVTLSDDRTDVTLSKQK